MLGRLAFTVAAALVASSTALAEPVPEFMHPLLRPQDQSPQIGVILPAKDLPNAFDAGWKGEKVCELLFENERMRSARCTFPPGVGHEKHWHGPHWGYVVEGSKMRITDEKGAGERAVKTGDSWWSDGIGWHEVVNVGDTTGVYVIIEPKEAAAP